MKDSLTRSGKLRRTIPPRVKSSSGTIYYFSGKNVPKGLSKEAKLLLAALKSVRPEPAALVGDSADAPPVTLRDN